MRIRWKLLIVLLVMALVPLVVMRWFGLRSAAGIRDELSELAREALTDDARALLLQLVKDHGRLLSSEKQTIEQALRLQARDAERYLAEQPAREADLRFGKDYTQAQLTTEQQVFLLAPGVDRAQVDDDLHRLSRMLPTYQLINQANSELILWQYTSLENGIHSSFPGHGGYPPNYDPRARPWYVRAQTENALFWSPPIVDAATGTLVITVAVPIYNASNQLAGVTAIDIPMVNVLHQVELPKEWAKNARVLLVTLEQDDQANRTLRIIAQQEYQAAEARWDLRVQLQTLQSDNPEHMARLIQDLKETNGSVREISFDSRLTLCAYENIDVRGTFLMVIVPQQTILQPATAAEAYVINTIQQQIALSRGLLIIAVIVIIVIALLGSRAVTQPLRELARTARRIADGDLAARAEIRSSDEIAEVGNTFNEMVPKLQERMNLKQSLSLAMEVQQSLLPEGPPTIEGLDIAGRSIYCDETGGDYYDFLELAPLGEHRLGVAVGDVTGHGIAAALLMATSRALLRSHVDQPGSLSDLMNHMNRHLVDDSPTGRFMTLFYMLIDAQQRTVHWSSAGHDPAFVYDPQRQAFDELAGEGIPLGIEAGWEYTESGPQKLAAGQVIVVGTDGIWEARNPSDEMFGKQRLMEIIRQHAPDPAQQICENITAELSRFQGTHIQEDDVTLVVVKIVGGS